MGEQQLQTSCKTSPLDSDTADSSFDKSTPEGLKAWIKWHYCQNGFKYDGTSKSLAGFREHLFELDTGLTRTTIRQALTQLCWSGELDKLGKEEIENMQKEEKTTHEDREKTKEKGKAIQEKKKPAQEEKKPAQEEKKPVQEEKRPVPEDKKPIQEDREVTKDDKKITPIKNMHETHTTIPVDVNLSDTDLLIPSDSEDEDTGNIKSSRGSHQIEHAPLISADLISPDTQNLLRQYGFMGVHRETQGTRSKLFLNTNIPFSIFLCGVQGSGKSHTTSCILENSLIPSKHLGKLKKPLSALVFSYGHFSGDGVGFTVSEAAFLASRESGVHGAGHVKKVNVLVSPSNYLRISKLYLQLPNVLVTPFKIKSRNLDITTMLSLMNVHESEETPLYMASVTQILREMSTAGGPFDYKVFKDNLDKQKFSPAQVNMLQIRLNLLESFLDMEGTSPEMHFPPGEIVIMDMSCPFVDPNTACILFEIGLQQYLQSKGSGKVIVLDEAHKYMLKIPGAKSLNETLLQTIRLQRHYGARVIVSTQEPTLLTDLIALCSVSVIHRFSSPEWFSALRRHIPIKEEDRDDLMRRIESLKTGHAIVYSPNAVLGFDQDDKLILGTSKMIDVRVRKRLTSDGGKSVLAV